MFSGKEENVLFTFLFSMRESSHKERGKKIIFFLIVTVFK